MPVPTSARRTRAQSRVLRRARDLAGGLALGLASLAVATPPASGAQAPAASFVVQPAADSQVAPAGGYFLLRPGAGTTTTQAVALRNDENRPLELRFAPTDATTGALGGVSYGLPTDGPSRTGAWIELEKDRLTLAPHASAILSFTVQVPAGTAAGQYLAGLAVWSPEDRMADGAQGGAGQAGATLTVQTRRIVAIQVDVPGPASAELGVAEVRAAARPDGMYLEILIDNSGTALTKAQGLIELPGSGFRNEFSIDTFVPGTSIAYPVKWTGQPDRGDHEARVTLTYGSERADWTGAVSVGGAVLEELEDRQVELPDGAGGLGTGTTLALAAAATAVAGVAGLSAGRRRKHTRRPSNSSGLPTGTAAPPADAGLPASPKRHVAPEPSSRRRQPLGRRRSEPDEWLWELEPPAAAKPTRGSGRKDGHAHNV